MNKMSITYLIIMLTSLPLKALVVTGSVSPDNIEPLLVKFNSLTGYAQYQDLFSGIGIFQHFVNQDATQINGSDLSYGYNSAIFYYVNSNNVWSSTNPTANQTGLFCSNGSAITKEATDCIHNGNTLNGEIVSVDSFLAWPLDHSSNNAVFVQPHVNFNYYPEAYYITAPAYLVSDSNNSYSTVPPTDVSYVLCSTNENGSGNAVYSLGGISFEATKYLINATDPQTSLDTPASRVGNIYLANYTGGLRSTASSIDRCASIQSKRTVSTNTTHDSSKRVVFLTRNRYYAGASPSQLDFYCQQEALRYGKGFMRPDVNGTPGLYKKFMALINTRISEASGTSNNAQDQLSNYPGRGITRRIFPYISDPYKPIFLVDYTTQVASGLGVGLVPLEDVSTGVSSGILAPISLGPDGVTVTKDLVGSVDRNLMVITGTTGSNCNGFTVNNGSDQTCYGTNCFTSFGKVNTQNYRWATNTYLSDALNSAVSFQDCGNNSEGHLYCIETDTARDVSYPRDYQIPNLNQFPGSICTGVGDCFSGNTCSGANNGDGYCRGSFDYCNPNASGQCTSTTCNSGVCAGDNALTCSGNGDCFGTVYQGPCVRFCSGDSSQNCTQDSDCQICDGVCHNGSNSGKPDADWRTEAGAYW